MSDWIVFDRLHQGQPVSRLNKKICVAKGSFRPEAAGG
jgi:hypothetical protein